MSEAVLTDPQAEARDDVYLTLFATLDVIFNAGSIAFPLS
jgi:hypothetical protein